MDMNQTAEVNGETKGQWHFLFGECQKEDKESAMDGDKEDSAWLVTAACRLSDRSEC